MNSAQIPNAEPTEEFLFEAPDAIHRILLIEIARGHGLPAFVRPRSRRRVWVRGAKAEVDAVAATARRLAVQLQDLQLKALVEVLEENGLRVSPNLLKLVATVDSPMAVASKREPPSANAPTSHGRGETCESEKASGAARARPAH